MRFHEVKKLIKNPEEAELFEVNMSPANLAKLAAAIPDALAGMEFEMMVPNSVVYNNDEDEEPGPDYSQNQPITAFSDIRDFFYDRDFNSNSDVVRLEEKIFDDFFSSDWLDEIKQREWEGAAKDAVSDLVQRDYDFEDQALKELQDETPEFGVGTEEFKAAYDKKLEQLYNDKVDEILAEMGPEYDEAYDEWLDGEWNNIWNNDELIVEWLQAEALNTMLDIQERYGSSINWPHYRTSSQDGDLANLALEFMEYIGDDKVAYSNSYHGPYVKWNGDDWQPVGSKKPTDCFTIEPDRSVKGDDSEEQAVGLEFVSPPVPIEKMNSVLEKVRSWADSNGAYTKETSSREQGSTGLHINVSVPNLADNLSNLDYVKLALLLGDKYVLDQFGRLGNEYAMPALDQIKGAISRNPDRAEELLQKMKDGLEAAASKIVHGTNTLKYTSINAKKGYIEFRGPGGDYLNQPLEKIQNTLLRFVIALDAAIDPEKYRTEYLKKLYQILGAKSKDNDTVKFFADYVAGKTPRTALKSFVRQAQLERSVAKGKQTGKMWWQVDLEGRNAANGAGIQVVASSKEEALTLAAREFGFGLTKSDLILRGASAYPVRAYEETPAQETLKYYNVRDSSGYTMMFQARNPTAAMQAAREQYPNKFPNIVDVVINDRANAVQAQQSEPIPDSTLDLQRQPAARRAGQFTGEWQVLDPEDREIYRFSGVGNNQSDANRVAMNWMRQNPGRMQAGVTVVPVMG